MADIELVIKIPEEEYRWMMKSDKTVFADVASKECMLYAIKNGTPLDKIRAEIDRQEKWLLQAGYTAYNVDIAFDAIKLVLAESEVEE